MSTPEQAPAEETQKQGKPFAKKRIHILLVLLIAATLLFTGLSYFLVSWHASDLYAKDDPALQNNPVSAEVAIVFGGGINNQRPLPLLQGRLDTAKKLLDDGVVTKAILSGDNRTLEYNEPQAMFDYMVSQGVDPDKLQLDQAGRSTYETCERAKKIFGLDRAILVSERTHLPRATFLCKSFGITTIGVISRSDAAKRLESSQQFREILARNKAIFNVYFYGEKTVLGDPINL